MPWSNVTAGGSNTTWSSQTAGGSNTTWSSSTAGGSNTTWSGTTAGGSNTTWDTGSSSRLTFGWIPFVQVIDLWGGTDFVPITMEQDAAPAPYKASIERPIQVWEVSAITASGFTAEAAP